MISVKRATQAKCWMFTRKLKRAINFDAKKNYRLLLFIIRNLDCLLLLLLLYILWCYYTFYYDVVAPLTPENPWWKCPVHKGWSIHGKVPRYDETLVDVLDVYKTPLSVPKLAKYPPKSEKSNQKLILFDHSLMEDISMDIDPTLCGGKCVVNFSNSKLHQKADAVVFSLKFPAKLPPRGFPSQLYVWMLLESPSTTLYSLEKKNRFSLHNYCNDFNLTMNYRRDADIYLPYNTTYQMQNGLYDGEKTPEEVLTSKTKFSAWVTGNCGNTKGAATRTKIMLKLLNAGLKVDIFGSCVWRSLPGSWMDLSKHIRPYKFYFSFENAFHCRDYITEKIWWNALNSGAIPVIWGPMRSDVEAVLPPNSFIFVEDFKSEQILIEYLNVLDKNDSKYLRYLEWRSTPPNFEIRGRKHEGQNWMSSKITGLCQLCHMIHDDDHHKITYGTRPQRIVKSIHKWWYINETKSCLSPLSEQELKMKQLHANFLFYEIWIGAVSYMRYYVGFCLLLVCIVICCRAFCLNSCRSVFLKLFLTIALLRHNLSCHRPFPKDYLTV